jgi:hypothetical protein
LYLHYIERSDQKKNLITWSVFSSLQRHDSRVPGLLAFPRF